jgi:hypothetical protein
LHPIRAEAISTFYNLGDDAKKAISTGEYVGQLFAVADTPGIDISPIGEISLTSPVNKKQWVSCALDIYTA